MEALTRIILNCLILIFGCYGWSYVPLSDFNLISSSDSIIMGTIHSKVNTTNIKFQGLPWTHYQVDITYILKSNDAIESYLKRKKSASDNLDSKDAQKSMIVSVIGGLDSSTGRTLHVTAAPNFNEGDSVLLFISHDDTNGNQINQINHFALGAFQKMEITSDGTSETVLVRSIDFITENNQESMNISVRKYAEFVQFIVRQVSVVGSDDKLDSDNNESYWTEINSDKLIQSHSTRFNTFNYQKNSIRWKSFDYPSSSVLWRRLQSGQIGLNGGAAIELLEAIKVWNDQPNTPISYENGLTTDTLTSFAKSDSINSILFEDPNNIIAGKYQCGIGGTLALGGWWTNGNEYTFRGIQFTEIVEADIVLQDGIGCWFSSQKDPSASYANLLTHELGHTLGLDHSCGNCIAGSDADNSVMRPNVHNDGGAFLSSDDNNGIEYIYSDCYPNCNTNGNNNEEIKVIDEDPKTPLLGLSRKNSIIIGCIAAFVISMAIVLTILFVVIRKRKNSQREKVRSRSNSLIIDPYDHIDIPGYMNVGNKTYISPPRISYYDHFAQVSNNLIYLQQQQNANNSNAPTTTSPYKSPRQYSNINLHLPNEENQVSIQK